MTTDVTPEEEARFMERHARQLRGAPSLAEVRAEVEAGKARPEELVRLQRMARHDVILGKHVAAYGRAEGVERFKAYWYGQGPDFGALEAEAQKAYGVSYVSLCCDRKRAVLTSVTAAKAEPLEAAQSPRRANIPRRGC
jgi:hypothetical protein